MGGFFFVSKQSNPAYENELKTGREQFALGGFNKPITFDFPLFIIDYYPKIMQSAHQYVRFASGDFIFATGAFFYGGRSGEEALKAFHSVEDSLRALESTHGHFAVVLRKNGRTILLTDPLGAYQVFYTRELQCVTTSFLAAAAATATRTIQGLETYEYVFNGVTLGNATPFREVLRLDVSEWMQLDPVISITAATRSLLPPEDQAPFNQLVSRNLERLLAYVKTIAPLFADNIRLALSGGYDSRLLLALFRRAGLSPRLFVYGLDTDADVRLAKHIATSEMMHLDHIDKSVPRSMDPAAYVATINTNFHSEDGLHPEGIFGGGAELAARCARSACGALHVSGGGGEIYRNFFYLFDRPLTPRAFVKVFYSGFDPAQCSPFFSARQYQQSVESKIARLVVPIRNRLSRRQVELLYPFFRCQSWFGRDISINNRWGYSIYPFLDHKIVDEGLRVPIRYKHFGNFESALIRAADPVLAGYPSNYGHDFARSAPPWAAVNWAVQYARPPWMRGRAFRIKSWLRGYEHRQVLLSADYLRQIIDLRFPYMSQFFRLSDVQSSAHFARICTLEYLYHRLSAR